MAFSTSFNQDFVTGALSVAALVLAKKIYDIFQYPSVANIEKVAQLPIPHAGDDESITVWGFAEKNEENDGRLLDFSPYVERVEAYLRLRRQEYKKEKTKGLSETPRQKVPFANIYGTMVDDSQRILNALQKQLKDDTERKLTDKQRVEGHMIRALLTGSLYWVLLHMNFGTEEGRQNFNNEMAKEMPAPILPLVMAMIIRGQNANLQGSGIGKIPHNDIIDQGKNDLRALSTIIGNRTYVLGTKEATAYDSDVYAFVGHFFYDSWISEVKWVQDIRRELPLLDQYMSRIRTVLYPDLKKTE